MEATVRKVRLTVQRSVSLQAILVYAYLPTESISLRGSSGNKPLAEI